MEAIKIAGRECMPLIYGFVAMFFIAAFIEGFWSPISAEYVPNIYKYIIGSCFWFLLAMYFIFAGRKRNA